MVTAASTAAFAVKVTVATPDPFVTALFAGVKVPAAGLLTVKLTVTPDTGLLAVSVTVAVTTVEPELAMAFGVSITNTLEGVPPPPPPVPPMMMVEA